jgi:hypothetical protein
MGVYIKDMEMPTECVCCPFQDDFGECILGADGDWVERRWNCPLAEVPNAIIRCKDCKHYTSMWYCEAWNNSPGFPAVRDDMFCSLAERRDNE